jgi:hypothetical protein
MMMRGAEKHTSRVKKRENVWKNHFLHAFCHSHHFILKNLQISHFLILRLEITSICCSSDTVQFKKKGLLVWNDENRHHRGKKGKIKTL